MSEWKGPWYSPPGCDPIVFGPKPGPEWLPYERRRSPQPDALVEALRAISLKYRVSSSVHVSVLLDEIDAALAAPRSERTYSAEEVQEAFVAGAMAELDGYGVVSVTANPVRKQLAEAEALRRYGERKGGKV